MPDEMTYEGTFQGLPFKATWDKRSYQALVFLGGVPLFWDKGLAMDAIEMAS